VENLTNTSWKEIEARKDVLSLVDQQIVYLEAPLGQDLFRLCWHSGRFTLQVTKLDAGKQAAIRKTQRCLPLTNWAYIQVDEQRPNYRVLLKMVYDSKQLQMQVVKDAKLRFPGREGDVQLVFD
jgi:hypothetical protein